MPKTKFENIVFTLFMSFLMVYAMICYNIALNMGGMSNQVFLLAFHELIIMWPVAFILEYFFVDKLAHYFAFKVVTPKDRPFFITLATSSISSFVRVLDTATTLKSCTFSSSINSLFILKELCVLLQKQKIKH